ncbi:DUF84 family protein [Enterobacter cloacae subsp. cloacae]|nr:DUF84 family protein [Enterobacter cloacae subsp. cloacae]
MDAVGVESGVPGTAVWQRRNARWRTNRVLNVRKGCTDADFWAAIEAGIDEGATFSWVVIESRE